MGTKTNMTPTSLHGSRCPECPGILQSLPDDAGLQCDNCGRWWAPRGMRERTANRCTGEGNIGAACAPATGIDALRCVYCYERMELDPTEVYLATRVALLAQREEIAWEDFKVADDLGQHDRARAASNRGSEASGERTDVERALFFHRAAVIRLRALDQR